MNNSQPWQSTPAELLRYGLKHLEADNEFDRQIAFLLIDLGVETLLKTFLLLSDEITGTTMPFSTRRKAAQSGFHELVDAVAVAAHHRLRDIELTEVKYFHSIRNKLYHEGDGVTPKFDSTIRYASLATALAQQLLDIEIRSDAERLHNEAELKRREAVINKRLKPLIIDLESKLRVCYSVLRAIFENYEDGIFAKKSFVDEMEALIELLSRPENAPRKSAIRRFISEGTFILSESGESILPLRWTDICDDFECFVNTWEYLDSQLPQYKLPFALSDRDIDPALLPDIVLADDITEAWLAIVHSDFFDRHGHTFMDIADYRRIKRFIATNLGRIKSSDHFDTVIAEQEQVGNELLSLEIVIKRVDGG